nr:phragmoplast-associated kinesin-related protein [Tanacetum cinerariifolium]
MSNRTAAASLNIQSSRSHNVFTYIVESQCKMDGLNCFKTSRMNLVDLAGTERQKATANINLSNILAEVSQTGKKRHIPYRDSKLRYLLQESLRGNAELSIVDAISPAQRSLNILKFSLRYPMILPHINHDKDVEMKIVDEERKCCKELRGTADGHGRPSTYS